MWIDSSAIKLTRRLAARTRAAAAAGLIAIAALAASADVITLKDGRVYEGKITERTPTTITIRTLVAGIAMDVEVLRADIKSIEEEDPPRGFPDDDGGGGDTVETPKAPKAPASRRPAERDRPERPARRSPDGPSYLEIPIHGGFGEDVTAAGVEAALLLARRRGVEHIVFTLDSPGGYLYEAEAIAGLIDEYRDEFTFHALIERSAWSAAMWIVASCDTVHAAPGAGCGAAVAYTGDATTGEAAVDAKFNSATAAQLAAIADGSGLPSDLFRAMVLMDLSVWAWPDPENPERYLTSASPPPSGTAGAQQIDTPATVLSLTAKDMERYGLARIHEGSAEELSGVLGIESWRSLGRAGRNLMERAARERGRLAEEIEEKVERVQRAVRIAQEADPRGHQYYYDQLSGLFTPASQVQWRKNTDHAIRAWQEAVRLLDDIGDLFERAEKTGAQHLAGKKSDTDEFAAEARQQIRRLRAERSRIRIDG